MTFLFCCFTGLSFHLLIYSTIAQHTHLIFETSRVMNNGIYFFPFQVDSGSPSTPNSLLLRSVTSVSLESGLSSRCSPRHSADDCSSVETSPPNATLEPNMHSPQTLDIIKHSSHATRTSDVSTQCTSVPTVSTPVQTVSVPTIANARKCSTPNAKNRVENDESFCDSVLHPKLDDLSSLKVSTDLLARLTSQFDYFSGEFRKLEENITEDKLSESPLLSDKSIPYILDSLNDSGLGDIGSPTSYHNSNGYKKRLWGTYNGCDITPSIHRPCHSYASEAGVVASTTTASATVTSL